jgi:hypothetical protein
VCYNEVSGLVKCEGDDFDMMHRGGYCRRGG